jgi:hypothetical protein
LWDWKDWGNCNLKYERSLEQHSSYGGEKKEIMPGILKENRTDLED